MAKDCPLCNNKRHIFKEGKGWVKCECVDQLRANRIMSHSGFPDALWEIESSTFKSGDDANRKSLAQGIQAIVKHMDKQPVFIYSDSPDKDRAAAIICRYCAIKHPEVQTIAYTTIDQLVQRQFGKEYEQQSETDPVHADITVVSIGKEMTNKAHMNSLYSLLYDRILAEKFTIVCSFLPKNRILQVYHKAIDDLMEKNFVFYSC